MNACNAQLKFYNVSLKGEILKQLHKAGNNTTYIFPSNDFSGFVDKTFA